MDTAVMKLLIDNQSLLVLKNGIDLSATMTK